MGMKHIIKHDLSPEQARKATDKAFETYRQKFADYNPTATWVNDKRAEISFSAKRITLDGAIELQPGQIELELDVPLLFRPFKGKAIAVIEESIQEWIAKAKKGELE